MYDNFRGFEVDGLHYNILTDACEHIAKNKVQGAILEIGTRRGGSSAIITSYLSERGIKDRVFVSIDPYGDIELKTDIHVPQRYDYDNKMRDETIPRLHHFASNLGFNFISMPMEDTEFFRRYADGIPVYNQYKEIINQYALVFLDGPHTTEAVMAETEFFAPRIPINGAIIYDNIGFYNHDAVEQRLFKEGFILIGEEWSKKAYIKCGDKMKKTIAFATGGLQFNGGSLIEKALGGSESAMIYMARELAALGNVVTVFCECDKPGNYDGVRYAPISEFVTISHKMFDVAIISRHLEILMPLMISNLTIFWMHDTYTPICGERVHLQDKIFLLSNFQKKMWVDANKNYEEMIWTTSNGFDKDIADAVLEKRKTLTFADKKNSYIFASRPERGLLYLLRDIWPKVLEENPKAILHVCSYDNPMIKGDFAFDTLIEDIEDIISETPSVAKLGHLTKPQLYTALAQCAYMIYPCDYPEISCINAIEAQALGCLVVTSDGFALSETVKTDTKVKAGTVKEYNDFLVAKVIEYQDEEKWTTATAAAKEIMHTQYSWRSVAASWDRKFNQMFEERYSKYKPQILQRLSHTSDHVTRMAVEPEYKSVVAEIQAHDYSYPYVAPGGMTGAIVPDGCTEVAQHARQTMMSDKIGEYLKERGEKGMTILDIGCHDGQVSGHVYKNNAEYIGKVIAYDGLPEALDAYKLIWGRNENCSNIVTLCDDVMNLKNHPEIKADVIIAGEIMEHVVDYKTFLEELQSHANPGALILFSTPTGPWSSLSMRERGESFGQDYHVHHYEYLDLLTIFENYSNADNQFFIDTVPEGARSHRNESCGNYIFGYINNATHLFKEYDMVLKAKKARPYFSLSVSMIVRNEENYLFKCLNSIKKIADEIIIVDTGSTDHSKDICALFTDKTFDLNWEEEDGVGSFERARNYGLDQCTGDFVFYIDADEELINGAFIGDCIRSEYVKSLMMLQRQISVDAQKAPDQMPNRIFRRGALRFTGVIHELPTQSAYRDNDICDMIIPRSVCMNHYGYMSFEVNRDKMFRNHKLLEKHMKKYPGQIDGMYYYMRDMMHLHMYTKEDKYLYHALKVWNVLPKNESYHRGKDFWKSSFEEFQYIFEELEKLGEVFRTAKINKKVMRFVDPSELKFYKKLTKNLVAITKA